MKYYIDYQYLPKNALRPIDEGTVVGIELDDTKGGVLALPNIGDFVHVISGDGNNPKFQGKVKSKLFRYFTSVVDGTQSCGINIVVEETDDNWGLLIKE